MVPFLTIFVFYPQWHGGLTCEAAAASSSMSGAGAPLLPDSELIKLCPMCRVPIEKDEGCAQMMCKRCKHVFCWYCLASLDVSKLFNFFIYTLISMLCRTVKLWNSVTARVFPSSYNIGSLKENIEKYLRRPACQWRLAIGSRSLDGRYWLYWIVLCLTWRTLCRATIKKVLRLNI